MGRVARCGHCHEELSLDRFYKSTRDGRTSCCKVCTNVRKKAWRKANPEKRRAGKKRHRDKHIEQERVRERIRYALNPNKRANNAAASRRRKNTPAGRAADAKYALARYYTLKNIEGAYTLEDLGDRLDLFDWCCAYCQGDFDTFDHDVPVCRGGTDWPENLFPTCSRCNNTKNRKTRAEWEAHKTLVEEARLKRA